MAKVNDVVLIYMEDAPVSFARVESILPDAKKDWYHIKLLMLQIPLQAVTWILKDEYITGGSFNMNGKSMRLETVESPIEEPPFGALDPNTPQKETQDTDKASQKDADIISFPNFKKKHDPESG